MISLERKYQARWKEERLFETDAPAKQVLDGLSPTEIREEHPKWFGSFPYPYMNGTLHLGHAFTISKVEFSAGYQRLLGKRVLFPHGLHATGMPIKVAISWNLTHAHLTTSQAASDRVQRELELFGVDFERYDPAVEEEKSKQVENGTAVTTVAVGKATKGKVAAKATGLTYQFQIMESMGIPRSEIKKFADPRHWLSYFPPICVVRSTTGSPEFYSTSPSKITPPWETG